MIKKRELRRGSTGKKGCFEGWYFKHEKKDDCLAVIPAFHSDGEGRLSASIQVITPEKSWNFQFPAGVCDIARRRFAVKIGPNLFTEKGIRLCLHTEGVRIEGRILYDSFTRIAYDIMGPFRFVPFLSCNHGILSMFHRLKGTVAINGERLDLSGGRGYVEKDWGVSFPSYYFWAQCFWRERKQCSLMVSVADIPFCGSRFPGCIACVMHEGVEYRFATYLGAKIERFGRRGVVLRQGKMKLSVKVLGQGGQELKAPEKGEMRRVITENLMGQIWCRLWKDGKLLTEYVGSGSAESVIGNKFSNESQKA